ncbi:MAG: DUF1566 domain-containing protein [Anaerolineales bacterium]|nr:DUF1566 domain-containing protein [Anaerolineales bacterium]
MPHSKSRSLLLTGSLLLMGLVACSLTGTLQATAADPTLAATATPVEQHLSYPIVDTGQTQCYDDQDRITCPQNGQAFFGQDAQVVGNQPAYQDNGDGTITDLVTGLMWQKTPGEQQTWAEALAGAESFYLAGYDDWRLPTIQELYSLMDFSGVDPSGWNDTDPSQLVPFIDTDYFDFEYGDEVAGERLIDAQYWSSTVYAATTMNGAVTAFGVNFADGRIKGYPSAAIGPPGDTFTMTAFVRYVRGNPEYGQSELVNNDDGTIRDLATGLTWVQADSGVGMDWKSALGYCQDLELAGVSDWRLPNAKELHSLVDYTRAPDTTASAAIDPVFQVSVVTDEGGESDYPFYWTSTTHANWSKAEGAWGAYLAFGEALGWMETPGGSRELMDVHGAGAQRSDPKSGDPAAWPVGNGPQGDVVRIYNYVRCVSDTQSSSPPPLYSVQLPTIFQ